jgi:hypothetical protein
MTVTIVPMPKPRTLPGSTRVNKSKESNGTNGRPAIFHPAKRIPTSAAVTIEVTNRPPDISRGKPFDFNAAACSLGRVWIPTCRSRSHFGEHYDQCAIRFRFHHNICPAR